MRKFGILLSITSLPSKYGIGTLGKSAYEFADFLKKSGAVVWQILPVNPTSYGDSPYQSFSTFAGNPYYIDLETLVSDGYMRAEDLPNEYALNNEYIDYGTLYEERFVTFKKAFDYSYEFLKPEIDAYRNKNPWLDDYGLFMALKEAFGGRSWQEWDDDALRKREKDAIERAKITYAERINFHIYLQYLFFIQFTKFKKYINKKGIELFGDMPIYVSLDSSDVWGNPELFDLDENLKPNKVAGVPPDYFSEDGQLWGNPLYNWEKHKETGYKWWIDRLASATAQYDILRLDHFIGFARYYTIPYGMKNAKIGEWEKGVGEELFLAAEKKLGKLNIIAEDLGVLTDEVIELREKLNFPGMRVIEFSFDPSDTYTVMPYEVRKHSVIYTGTHDNDTLNGWWDGCDGNMKRYIAGKFGVRSGLDRVPSKIIKACINSNAELAVIPMQDILGLDTNARMNVPGTVGNNWKWRVDEKRLTDLLAHRLKRYVKEGHR